MCRITVGRLAAISLVCLASSSLCAGELKPPVAPAHAEAETLFGHILRDPYHWLRDETRTRPDVIAYLDSENAYTDALTEPESELKQSLYDEMVARVKATDETVPVRRGDYFYYSRTEEGKQYEIHCRRQGSLEAPEEIVLDVNRLAEGKHFMDLGMFEVSPDNSTLAYGADTTGNELYVVRFKDMGADTLLADTIEDVYPELAWASDNRTVFYIVMDEAWRPYEVFRHTLGRPVADDSLVYYEPDERFWVEVSKSKSDEYIFIRTASETSSECLFLKADEPRGELTVIRPRRPEVEYECYHQGPYFYIRTNEDALNFKLMRTRVDGGDYANWTEVIAHRPAVMLRSVDCFKDFIVLYERAGGLPQISIWNPRSETTDRVGFTEPTYVIYADENPEYASEWLRFRYESPITPESVIEYNMTTDERVTRKQQEVPGYDRSAYTSDRITVPAEDGTEIPVSLVWRRGLVWDGSNPLYLYGYGAYGLCSEPYFSYAVLSLLDRGFVFAIAHVRGGGELGREWYYEGRLLNKKNTFTDFIAVADYLVAAGYADRDKLVISGASAGGLLIGAVLNMRPDLCRIAVAEVPFVDIMNTMLDESIPLTVTEYEEWGNPNQREYFEYMLSYSPYDNVGAYRYPAMFVTAGLYDTRVAYWEPTKWVAKIRATKAGESKLILRVNMGAGHGGPSGRYSRLEEIASEYAFILDIMAGPGGHD
jgi:oligopeptidase B